jgi:hypothetical protein
VYLSKHVCTPIRVAVEPETENFRAEHVGVALTAPSDMVRVPSEVAAKMAASVVDSGVVLLPGF